MKTLTHFCLFLSLIATVVLTSLVDGIALTAFGIALACVLTAVLYWPATWALRGLAALLLCLIPAMTLAQTADSVELSGWLAIFEALPGWLVAITSVVTAATAITALTPTKADDTIINAILRVLNILAGNFAKNTNADD